MSIGMSSDFDGSHPSTLTQLSSTNVTVGRSPFRVDPRKLHIPKGEDLPPAPLPKRVEEWFFLSSGDNPG
jgi:hypothetical protein